MGAEVTLMDEPLFRALDRIGQDQVLGAISLVRRGTVYDLGLELNARVPQGVPGAFAPYGFAWTHIPSVDGGGEAYDFCAESITATPHIGTHIDGLMHATSGGRTFGGSPLEAVLTDQGFIRDGIESVPPIVTRALVLDACATHGEYLPDGYDIGPDELARLLADLSLEIRQGDAVLVRTGKVRQYGVDNDAYQAAQPGVGRDGAIWLFDRGMAVLGTDTTGTEPLPFSHPDRTTHQAMLVDRGVHLIENLNLEGLSADAVHEGLFICLPLRLTGATGSWVRPVVIV